MRYLVTIIFVWLCAGCTILKQDKDYITISNAPQPPVIAHYCSNGDCNYKKYADDLNWYMIYIFTYTKAINEFALSKGWKSPPQPPVCRLVEWPQPAKYPEFTPKKVDGNLVEFEWELTRYIKRLRALYDSHADDIHDASSLQKTMCTY